MTIEKAIGGHFFSRRWPPYAGPFPPRWSYPVPETKYLKGELPCWPDSIFGRRPPATSTPSPATTSRHLAPIEPLPRI